MKARMMAVLGLLAAGSASAQSPHDPWAYCQAWDKQSKSYIFFCAHADCGQRFSGPERSLEGICHAEVRGEAGSGRLRMGLHPRCGAQSIADGGG